MYEQPRAVVPGIQVVLARNPSPMTLLGTNTYLLRRDGAHGCVVVDPGPDDDAHLQVLMQAGPVEAILLTHGHPDHAAGAVPLSAATGAQIRVGTGTVSGGGFDIDVVPTPGHTPDSVCFVVDGAVLTGDTVLGQGTSVLGTDDGALRNYLASLHRLAGLGARVVLPGHGPTLPDLAAVCTDYINHRRRRIEQVRAAVQELGGSAPAAEIVRRVYTDVDPALWTVAERSVEAALDYLRTGD